MRASSDCRVPDGPFAQVDSGSGGVISSRDPLEVHNDPSHRTHACGIRRDGAVECWGSNDHGESTPPPPWAGSPPFTDIAAGFAHTCLLDDAGEALCWGNGVYGQTNPPPGPFTDLTAGQWHTCGLRPDGEIACWGDGPADEYENYDEPPEGVAAEPPPGPFTAVSAGRWHTCALRPNGDAECWLSY